MAKKRSTITQEGRSSIKALSRQRQIDKMRDWFFEHFEDPAQNTPYESAEGGYIWIHGGPYDAREELENEFSDEAKSGAIEELVEELNNECWEWAGTLDASDYEYLEPDLKIRSGDDPYKVLCKRMRLIKTLIPKLSELNLEQASLQRQLLFSSCITALETYFSDCFTIEIKKDKANIKRLFSFETTLKSLTVGYGDLLDPRFNPKKLALDFVERTSFHNLPRIKRLFKGVLDRDLGDIGKLKVAIDKRHDLVHRAGKTRDGKLVKIKDAEITELANIIESFCSCHHSGRPYKEFVPTLF
jgi:hypothetical protein